MSREKSRIFLIPLLAILLILSAPLSAIALAQTDPPIQDLYSTEYFPTVHQEFQNARESIVVTMYQISLYPNSTNKSPRFWGVLPAFAAIKN